MNLAVATAALRLSVIQPAFNGTFPDMNKQAYYIRIAEKPLKLPDGREVRYAPTGLYWDHLLHRHFSLNVFQTGFPYTAEPVIIIRFCDAVAGTPADNAHAGRAALAFPDLGSPFLETEICGRHRCF